MYKINIYNFGPFISLCSGQGSDGTQPLLSEEELPSPIQEVSYRRGNPLDDEHSSRSLSPLDPEEESSGREYQQREPYSSPYREPFRDYNR